MVEFELIHQREFNDANIFTFGHLGNGNGVDARVDCNKTLEVNIIATV